MAIVFLVAALVLFVLGGLGVHMPPRAELWGLACLAAAFVIGGVPLPWRRPPA